MRPTEIEIGEVVAGWSCLKFFPSATGAMFPIIKLLSEMVSTREQLHWLDSVMVNQVGEWPGPAELRAIFCTRFRPADGIEGKGYSSIAGFTPGDIETENLVKHAELTAGADKRTGQMLPAGSIKLLGAGFEPPVSEAERATIDELNEKIRLRNKAERDRVIRERIDRRKFPQPIASEVETKA